MGKKLLRWAWATAPLALFIGLIFGFQRFTKWHPAILEPDSRAVYHYTPAGWSSVPPLPNGDLETIETSASSALWAMADSQDDGTIFARLDGAQWRVYRMKELDPKRPSFYAPSWGFVIDGEQLWVAGRQSIAHWDGEQWQEFRDHQADSIAASGGEAWAVDSSGHLSHYADGRWSPIPADPPAERWEKDTYEDSKLLRTADGSLWLARTRLWRFDGTRWNEIPTGFEYIDLLCADDSHVWIWYGDYLHSFSPDGTRAAYTRAELGVDQFDGTLAGTSRGGHTWFTTLHGPVEFDGKQWRRLPMPPGKVERLTHMAAGPDYELWAIGSTPNPMWRYTRWVQVAQPFVIILSLLAVPVWMVRRYKRAKLEEHQRMHDAVQHATGESPDDFERTERRLAKESSWFGASVSVVLPIAALMGFQVLRIFWHSAPSWMFLLLALAFHLVTVLWRSLMKKTPKPWDPIEPGGAGYDWSETRKVLPGTLALFVLLNFGDIQRLIGDPVIWGLVLFWAWFAYHSLSVRFLNRALSRAEYDEAGKVIVRFHLYNPDSPKALRHRTLVLLVAGRYREAEETARRALAVTRNSWQATVLDYLGSALMEQGRYDEATRSFEAALKATPKFRRPYIGLANVVLRQHRDPRRALELLEQVGTSKRPLGPELRDEYWALKAWALAESGQTSEVAPAIENAFRYTPQSKPGVAFTCYNAGMAMLAMGEEAKAREYFQRARNSDPEGRWGKLAKEALGERSVFRV
jgi:tetratricopeptide (TPR) repeat protein